MIACQRWIIFLLRSFLKNYKYGNFYLKATDLFLVLEFTCLFFSKQFLLSSLWMGDCVIIGLLTSGVGFNLAFLLVFFISVMVSLMIISYFFIGSFLSLHLRILLLLLYIGRNICGLLTKALLIACCCWMLICY